LKFRQSLYLRFIKPNVIYKYYLVLLSVTLLAACSKPSTEETAVDLGYNYYPLVTGDTRIYRVDSLVYDNNSGFTTIDTFTYQYKEIVGNTFTDLTGKQNWKIQRYFRMHDTLPWIEANTSTTLVNELQAQRVDENTRFVKLVFPVEKAKIWNGNMFNARPSEDWQITAIDEQVAVGAATYNQTLQVVQKNEINFIEEIVRYERYARNVGMVYLLSDSINTQVEGSRGFRYRLTLLSFTPNL